VYKPPGLHSAPLGADEPDTLLAAIAKTHPEILEVRGRKPHEGGLLHRLDRETSGLLLVARRQDAFEALLELSEQGGIVKEYRALCETSTSPPPGLRALIAPAGMNSERWAALLASASTGAGFTAAAPAEPAFPLRIESGFRPYGPERRMVAAITPDGSRRSGATSAYVTEILSITPYTLAAAGASLLFDVATLIRRGFRHQIRCHLASIGLPIAGDPLYSQAGGHAFRLSLHAETIRFTDPDDGSEKVFTLPFGRIISGRGRQSGSN
jgi:23S rRNA pseudouridine1911/1915/1917 synthase